MADTINIIKNYGSHNMTAKPNRKIDYIVIHYTAGVTSKSGCAMNTSNWYNNPQCVCSSDFTVDDTTVVQYNADIKNKYTWHCGGTVYNNKGGKFKGKCTNANSIGIEICSTNSTGKMQNANDKSYSFTPAAVNTAVELVKYLMKQYNIDIDHIVRHYDCTGKLCPGIYGWNDDSGSEAEWENFKNRLQCKAPVLNADKYINNAVLPYRIKIIDDTLNVRKNAGVNNSIVTTVKKGDVFTIVEEKEVINSNGSKSVWGKLKSGIGYINLGSNYVQKINGDTMNFSYVAVVDQPQTVEQTVQTMISNTVNKSSNQTILSPYKGKFRVSQEFKGTAHQGLDLVGIDSKNIYSTVNGKVEIAGNNDPNGFGIYVRILADNGWRYYYGHLSQTKVKVGDKVKCGDLIGIEGNTGRSTGNHCHYEIRKTSAHSSFADINEISGIPNKIGTYENGKITTDSKAESGKTLVVNSGNWNIRSKPNINSEIITVIKGGTKYKYTAVVNGWAYIPQLKGYIASTGYTVK